MGTNAVHQVPDDDCLRNGNGAHRRSVFDSLLDFCRNRYVAAFVISFAVAYGFHVVEKHNDAKIATQAALTRCVVERTAAEQERIAATARVNLHVVLRKCEKQVYKK